LKERVDFVLTEFQRSSLDDQDTAHNKLQDWLRGVVSNLQEVEVRRTLVKTPLCIRAKNPMELDLSWLSKINVKTTSPDLTLVQRNAELVIGPNRKCTAYRSNNSK
jgi:hypothetical protein